MTAKCGWIGALGVALVTFVASLPVQEMAVRFALPEFNPSWQVRFHGGDATTPTLATPGTRLRQIKNTGDYNVIVRINHRGLRDEQDVAEARAEDWVVVGDSFGFGWGVDVSDRYSEQLAMRLGQRVFNISIPGGLENDERLLDYAKRLGGEVQQVIVQVTMERDIKRWEPVIASEMALAPLTSSRIQVVKEWLLENSELYFLFTSQIHQVRWLNELAAIMGLVRRNLDGVHKAEFDGVAVADTADKVARLVAPYRQSAALIIPARSLWAGSAEDRIMADQTHRAFIAALADRNVRVVDMRGPLENGGEPLRYHFANDGHWNPRGHILAAMRLAEVLTSPSATAGR